MILEPFDPLTDPRWADLVRRSPNAAVFHTAPWLHALRRTYGYTPVAVSDSPAGQPIRNALLFCRVNSWLTGRRLVSLPFSDHCDPLLPSHDDGRSLLEAAAPLVAREHVRYVEVRLKTSLHPPAGFIPTETFALHAIDLSQGADVAFRRFDKNHVQRSIRKAERLGVTVEAGRSPEFLRAFYALHTLTRAKHQAPVQPVAWFQSLADAFRADLSIYLARVDGTPVAAILTLLSGKTMVYKYGCSNAAYNRYGATSLLFWRAIQDAAAAGAEEMDLGRSDLDNPGLIAFKDRLGARRTDLKYYRCTGKPVGASASRSRSIARLAFGLAPRSLTNWAGTRLYRHFG